MKISNLINQLKSIQLEHGDIECKEILDIPVCPDATGGYYDRTFIEPNIEVIDNFCGEGKILLFGED